MITNDQILIQHLATWLAEYAEQHGLKTFVVVDNRSRQSALVRYICSEATKVIGGLKVRVCDTNHIDAHTIAKENFGIVVGIIDRTSGLYYRGYEKLNEGLADVYPILDLEFSEVIQVTDRLFPDAGLDDNMSQAELAIWRYVEFCNNTNTAYGIITDEQPPQKNKRWPYFLTEQKKWIGIVHQREKATRHKAIIKPYPEIPEVCRRIGQ